VAWAVQYDAAVDPEVAKTKIKGESQVAGRATVLIVPDLNVGNIVYKVGPFLLVRQLLIL
jgi:phosphate acetyltransferase